MYLQISDLNITILYSACDGMYIMCFPCLQYVMLCMCLSGIRGTYQGLTATVLKQGSNQAIRFFVMTSLRNWYKGVCLCITLNIKHCPLLLIQSPLFTLLVFLVVFQVTIPTNPSTPSSQERLERLPERRVCLETRLWTSSRPECRSAERLSAQINPVTANEAVYTEHLICCIETHFILSVLDLTHS